MGIGLQFIDGVWMPALSGKTREIINPADGSVLAIVAEGDAADVQLAVAAARRAFDVDGWADTTPHERAAMLHAVCAGIEAIRDELIQLETQDNGKPLRESEYDINDTIACFRYYAGMAEKPHGQTFSVPDPNIRTMVVREPMGVCGQIVPWNYPLLMAAWKLAPALAAGNTVVFKPSELTPLSTIRLFEIFETVGFPKGVVNLVMGAGATVGHEIAANHDVDKVAFTGGTATGRSIMQAATGNLKNISLELGGKSPNIVFADVDLEAAVDYAMFAIFCNQGQVCSAGSRLLLEESIHDAFVERLVTRANQIAIGPGADPTTEMGPLISERHMERVLSYIQIGIEEGAKLRCGGHRLQDDRLKNGWFVAPTVFTDVTPDMRIVREEIFGPVLVVQKFRTEKEAIAMANDTVYGLAGGVFTNDGAKAMRVIGKLRAGITWINTYNPTFNEAPWGGYRQSGIGRELGTFGYEEYTEVKQINMNLNPGMSGWFEVR